MRSKIFVEVTARFDTDGSLTPLDLVWEDGRRYPIDRVLDVRRAASLKAGGARRPLHGTNRTLQTVFVLRPAAMVCGGERLICAEDIPFWTTTAAASPHASRTDWHESFPAFRSARARFFPDRRLRFWRPPG